MSEDIPSRISPHSFMLMLLAIASLGVGAILGFEWLRPEKDNLSVDGIIIAFLTSIVSAMSAKQGADATAVAAGLMIKATER